MSLSGPGPHLSKFRQQLKTSLTTKFAHVHSWYHGGDQLNDALIQVLRDIEQRNVGFPSFRDLKRPLRSTHNGLILDSQHLDTTDLAGWVVRHMLINPVDWVNVSKAISVSVEQSLRSHTPTEVEVVSFGPSTESILADIRSRMSDHRLRYIDRSSFQSKEHQGASASEKESIAIVGMGVHFPKGKGQQELWETLSGGLNAISDVRMFV